MSLPRHRIAGERLQGLGGRLRGGGFGRRLGDAGLLGTILASDFPRHGRRLGSDHLAEQLIDRDGGDGHQGDDDHVFDQLIGKATYRLDL